MIRRAYSPARYVHSPRRGGRCIRAAQGFALGYDPPPRGLPPRVSPWAMVHRAYSPAGYVPFGPCGPFGLLVRVPVRPVGAPNHSPGRNPGRAGYVPFGPGGPLVCWCGYPCAPGFRRPGFRPGLWSGGPTGRSGYVPSGTRPNSPASADAPTEPPPSRSAVRP